MAANVLLLVAFVWVRCLVGSRGKIGSHNRLITGKSGAITLWRWAGSGGLQSSMQLSPDHCRRHTFHNSHMVFTK
jgi:hypothetical protein